MWIPGIASDLHELFMPSPSSTLLDFTKVDLLGFSLGGCVRKPRR
jgi:hypothetical protein